MLKQRLRQMASVLSEGPIGGEQVDVAYAHSDYAHSYVSIYTVVHAECLAISNNIYFLTWTISLWMPPMETDQ